MRNLTLFAVFLLFSNLLHGQSQQISLQAKPNLLPDYFVLKNEPDTIFVDKVKQYALTNGRFTNVEFTTNQGKRKFTKQELANIQACRMYDKPRLLHVFEGDKIEHLGVLTEGPLLLLVRGVYMEMETEDEIEMVRTEHYYWWQAGKMIEVDTAAITKGVEHLTSQCNINTESPGTSDKDGLIQLTNQLNQHCNNQLVW